MATSEALDQRDQAAQSAAQATQEAARLQAATNSTHPVLLDYKPEWGHTPVQPYSTKIEALAERLAFVCHELGVPLRPERSL